MKRILLPILAIILAACLSPSEDQPAPSALPTVGLPAPTQPPPTATVPPSATPDPLDSISPEVRELGEEEAREILGSIEDGSIEYVDYGAGSITEAQIDLESFKAQTTVDWYFDNIVTATAKDKDGNEFKVVWNKDENHWIRADKVTEETTFRNFDKMLKTGDIDLVLYAQEFVDPKLPEKSITPQYWVNFHMNRWFQPNYEFFLTLSNNPISDWRPHTREFIREGFFGKENQPYQDMLYVNAINSDGTSYKAGLKPVVNTNGEVIIFKLGLDNRQFEQIIIEPGNSIENQVTATNPVPVFSFPNDVHRWDDVFKSVDGSGNGKKYGLRVPSDYMNDVIVALHESNVGELFLSLPEDVQEKMIQTIIEKKSSSNPDHNLLNVFLESGISNEMAMILSRSIHVTMFDQLPSFDPHNTDN
jgi:hypothetical protein